MNPSIQLTRNTSKDEQGKRRRSPISPSDSIICKKHQPATMPGGQQLGSLNMDQLLHAIRTAIKAENLATKDDLAEIKQEVDSLRSQNVILKQTIEELVIHEKQLEERLEKLENSTRKGNIVIYGLDDTNDPKTTIHKLCNETLQSTENIIIKRALKIGESKPGKPILLAELDNPNSVGTVLRNRKKLAGTQIYLSRDLAPAARQRRRKLTVIKSALNKHNPKIRTRLNDDKLIIERRIFTWYNDNLVCNKNDGIKEINNIYKTEFRNVNDICARPSVLNHALTTGNVDNSPNNFSA